MLKKLKMWANEFARACVLLAVLGLGAEFLFNGFTSELIAFLLGREQQLRERARELGSACSACTGLELRRTPKIVSNYDYFGAGAIWEQYWGLIEISPFSRYIGGGACLAQAATWYIGEGAAYDVVDVAPGALGVLRNRAAEDSLLRHGLGHSYIAERVERRPGWYLFGDEQERLATLTAYEGVADFIMIECTRCDSQAAAERLERELLDQVRMLEGLGDDLKTVLEKDILRDRFGQGYDALGLVFVKGVVNAKSRRALDIIIDSPPKSIEELLEPARYLRALDKGN